MMIGLYDNSKKFFNSVTGKILLSSFLILGTFLLRPRDGIYMICVALCSIFLGYFCKDRLSCLAPISIIFFFLTPGKKGLGQASSLQIFIFLVLFIAFLICASRIKRRGVFAHPVIFIFSVIIGGVLLLNYCSSLPSYIRGALVLIIAPLATLKCYITYAVANVTAKKHGTVLENIGTVGAFGAQSVPAGTGLGWLKKLQVRNTEELVNSQILSAKLLISSLAVGLLKETIKYFNYSYFRIPDYSQCIQVFADGHPYSATISLWSLFIRFILQILSLYVIGNIFIIFAKFSGFKLPQGSMNTLYSRDIADFWNRIYFYFKEWLVYFFFYPAFKTFSFLPDRSRVFCATFMAAGVGNFLYHFVSDLPHFCPNFLTFTDYCHYSSIYGFYSIVLALVIGLSQLHNSYGRKREGRPTFRVGRFLIIISFYFLLNNFDVDPYGAIQEEGGKAYLITHLEFLGYMLGLYR